MAAATTSSPKISLPPLNGWLLGDDHGGELVAGRDEREHEIGGFGSNRM